VAAGGIRLSPTDARVFELRDYLWLPWLALDRLDVRCNVMRRGAARRGAVGLLAERLSSRKRIVLST